MVQPWFRRFTRAVEPASPRFHPCFSQVPLRHGPEFLGKPLQDCLRALGMGQGADPPAAPVPQAAAAAVVTAQVTVHASSSRPRWSCHQVGSTNRRSSSTRRLRAACWLWAPPSQVGESTRRPRQAPRQQQRRQRQWHHRHSCSQVWFKRSKGCNRCAVVQPSFQRVQPCG